MKLTKVEQIHDFLAAVDKCREDVWLESRMGDRINLKSPLSAYVAIGALLGEKGNELELFCGSKDDEVHFFEFFNANPEVI